MISWSGICSAVIVLMLLISQGASQVLQTVRDQPILSRSTAIPSLSCCGTFRNEDLKGSSSQLMSCINMSLESCTVEKKSLAIVGYFTENILNYAAYSAAINTIYAQYHGYHIRHLTAADGAEYFPQDQRWNKVKILLDAFQPEHGWARDMQYLVWLDSDLVILDLGLDIIAVAEAYPHSDIILCADKDISVGIANTGFVIVRNTPFVLDFLQKWWYDYDKATAMDQYAFTKLYQIEKQLRPLKTPINDADDNISPYSTEHITILRPDALNSNFPSWLRQRDHNQVLHLAGANREMRMRAFQEGLKNICGNINGQRIPVQIGLTRETLAAMDASLPRAKILNSTLEAIGAKLEETRTAAVSDTFAAEVVKLTQALNEDWTMHTHVHEISGGLDRNHHQLIISGYLMLYEAMENAISRAADPRLRMTYIQSLLNGLFLLCSEMTTNADNARTIDILSSALPYINELHQYSRQPDIAGGSGTALWKYEYMFHNRFAEYYQMQGDTVNELKQRTIAVGVWWEMFHAGEHNKFGPNPHDLLADPHHDVAVMLDRYAAMVCAGGGGNLDDALKALDQSLLFHEEVWTSREFHPQYVTEAQVERLYSKAFCLQQKYDAEKGNKDLLLLIKKHLQQALKLTDKLVERQQHMKAISSSLTALESKLKIAENSHKKTGRFWRKGAGSKSPAG